MNDGHLLAIDVGTGSVRAVLFSANGVQASYGQREYSHREIPGVPGSQVFDTTATWSLIGQCVREALNAAHVPASTVRAVSATSMREGMVLYDGDGVETWACPNADSRASEEARSLISSGAAQEIYRSRRRLGGDHSSGPVPLDRPPRARGVLAYRTCWLDWRLGAEEIVRAVRHGSFARVELRHVRFGRARMVRLGA